MKIPRAQSILWSKQATDRAGLADRKVRSWRNFSAHFNWRRLAVSSSVFSQGISAAAVFRACFTELERKTDPDDEDIVVPSQAAIGFPRCGAPRGANPNLFLRCCPSLYLSRAGPVPPGLPSPRISCGSLTGAANSFRNGRLRQTLPPRVRHCLRASPERVTHALTWRNAMF